MKKTRRFALPLALFLLAGCAGMLQGYGRFLPDDATEDMFLSYQVNPAYNYFYSGPDAIPNAILGVDKTYTLASRVWKPVDLTPARLKTWVSLMENQGAALPPAGQAIMDARGKQVGVWLSYYSSTYVKVMADNSLEVALPDLSKPYYNLTPFNVEDW